jgi:hypothetical protein
MSNQTVNVVCLKWGTKYPAEYVNRLYRMVKTHLTLPFRFVCLTDSSDGIDAGIEVKPLLIDPDLKGWWYKLQLFKPELYDLSGSTIFLDLDVVIVSNIDDLFTYNAQQFCIIKDLQAGKIYNSSVFRFDVGAHTDIWQGFEADKKNIMARMHGDQDWISETVSNAVTWPKEWVVSYKKQCNSRAKHSLGLLGQFLRKRGFLITKGEAEIPHGAKVVYFHGKPDPDDVVDAPYDMWKKAPWIKAAWQGEE